MGCLNDYSVADKPWDGEGQNVCALSIFRQGDGGVGGAERASSYAQ
jgi:hypothetical protein